MFYGYVASPSTSDTDRLPTRLASLIIADATRLHLLKLVASLDLPDCWIGAGFVRSAVWDHLHGIAPNASWDDIDVVWYDRTNASAVADSFIETRLHAMEPSMKWEVTNQARMHDQNGDLPYLDTENAISRWPETATAIAIRWNGDTIDVLAPHGLDDMFSLVLRPTPAFMVDKLPIFRERVRKRHWRDRWPKLIAPDM